QNKGRKKGPRSAGPPGIFKVRGHTVLTVGSFGFCLFHILEYFILTVFVSKSNGQRDILSFMALLLKARTTFKKRDVILIIDEIFDYLDEGNLITFQYFITKMIEDMKSQGRNFFLILLTHLDPLVFNHFCFNRHKIKVVYLKDLGVKSNPNLLRLIRKREDLSIQASADKHHFHFHPGSLDISTEFDGLGLLRHWGESERFHQFISEQIDNYL
ncbi:MAG: hypothetical protein JWP44_4244, partial [Mucilaginibacter sp.]|nr:hypothetical protein [Mucilaginibacter sp.]